MKVDIVRCGPPVNESERKAIEHLKIRLIGEAGDEHWILLTNLMFSTSHRHQADEIDIVAIGPPGVRVIEVKHWSQSWVKQNPLLVEKEADSVTMKARRIGTALRKRVPNLDFVHGVFLVTEQKSKSERLEKVRVAGVSFHTLKNWREAVGLELPQTLSSHQVRLLADSLAPEGGLAVEGRIKRIADYTQLELQGPPDQRSHRIYRATHRSRRDRVILHLYDLSAEPSSKANERARREFEALHRLQRRQWAPRIVDSFQDVPGYAGEICFFTIADPGAPSLESRGSDRSWSFRQRLKFARRAVQALKELHDSGDDSEPMLHRNLSPRTILVRHDDSPVFTGFLHTRIPAAATVASADRADSEDCFRAPEVQAQGRSAADRRSDTYSLCAALAVLFQGMENPDSPRALAALALGAEPKPRVRSSLKELEASLSKLLGEPVTEPSPEPPPARFWSEDQEVRFRNRDYRIASRLGSGGVGTAFKVVELASKTGSELGAFVAKVVGDPDTGKRVLTAYERSRPYLRHPGLSTILEVADDWSDREFVALMTWIEGEPLSEYAGLLTIHAEDIGMESGELLAILWLREACEALGVLHRNGLIHGDISPSNLIVSDNRIVVTDYDCVSPIGERAAAPGTVHYCSPSYLEKRPAAPADDFYALASSFFQILFEREPFQFGGERAKERGLNWDDVNRSEFEVVAAFLDRATDPDPRNRFASATEALAVLGRAEMTAADDSLEDATDVDPIALTDNEVPWLDSLLRAYPGSPRGNDETRGLDSEFAESTYVPTRLEASLHEEIRRGQVQLVILSGNAGDGKTALLQHLARRLGLGEHSSADRIIKDQTDAGMTVRMNLDGSAAWRKKSADELLDELLEPFQDGRSEQQLVHLLAINDGRLLEWMEDSDDTMLVGALGRLIDGEPAPDADHIRFIDLNQRSLVGHIAPGSPEPDTGFLERLLDSLYGGQRAPQIWAPCQTCKAKPHCKIWRATRLFGPESLPTEDRPAPDRRRRARARLFEALQAVHLRGEAQITVRELRAALVYILFGVHFCTDYHAGAEAGPDGERPVSYFQRAFAPESPFRQGEVLRELARLDPALESHARIDRRLLYSRVRRNGTAAASADGELNLDADRRQAFFEWTEEEIKEAADDPLALPLAGGRHFHRFGRLVASPHPQKDPELVKQLCRGISRLEMLPQPAQQRGTVQMRIVGRTPTDAVFWVEKELVNFQLAPYTHSAAPGLDRLPRQAILSYRRQQGDGEMKLLLGAELFSVLLDLSEGYQLGAVSTDDVFAQLAVFVQRITQEDERRLFAWTPMEEKAVWELVVQTDKSKIESAQLLVMRRTAVGVSN